MSHRDFLLVAHDRNQKTDVAVVSNHIGPDSERQLYLSVPFMTISCTLGGFRVLICGSIYHSQGAASGAFVVCGPPCIEDPIRPPVYLTWICRVYNQSVRCGHQLLGLPEDSEIVASLSIATA